MGQDSLRRQAVETTDPEYPFARPTAWAATRLGRLEYGDTVDPDTGFPRPNAVAATSVPGIGVVVVDGSPRIAIDTRCPHRGADLVQHGCVADDGMITCRHRGYSWSFPSCRPASQGATGDAGALRVLGIVYVDEQGEAWLRPGVAA